MDRRTFISTTVGRHLVAAVAVEARVSARCTLSSLTSLLNRTRRKRHAPVKPSGHLTQQGASYGYDRTGNANNG
jgi:hypothetical protein